MDSKQVSDPYHKIYHMRSRSVFFVSTIDDTRGHFHFGCWSTQCSHEPPRMLTCFAKEFEGAEIVRRSGKFALSMPSIEQMPFHDRFASGQQSLDALGREHFLFAKTGCPVLKDAVTYIDCQAVQFIDNGDFLMVIGEIVDGQILHPERKPLNVEFIKEEAERKLVNGEIVLPFKGFNL